MIVVGAAPGGGLEIGADARFPLRLIRDSSVGGRLGSTAVSRVTGALGAFLALARGSGARATVAVATAAVRDAANRDEFVRRVAARTGVELEVLEGDVEARHAFAGAVHGLPVDSGLVVDIGGGSVEVCRFQDRRPLRQWTLPLGALLLSDRFLESDPPRSSEISRARQHVMSALEESEIPPLRPGESLVGTGGTLRNLAKVDRARRTYPITRLHGYRLSQDGLDQAADTVSSRSLARRRRVSGLSRDRADSIVGGALCAQALFAVLGAGELLLSGRGLREGIALERLGLGVPSVAAMRRSSVAALARRFSSWDGRRAQLRAELAARLLEELDAEADAGLREVLEHASTLVDIGRSVDYYSRWEHAARIVADSDLYGFSHREIVLLSAVLERAGEDRVTLPGYRALLAPPDRGRLQRLAVILVLADALSHRLLPGEAVATEARRSSIILIAPGDLGPLEPDLEQRFRRIFGKALRLSPAPPG
jgi:exopolyphosphatase/guanosine-5'-triphosphate,3'-diphosphate pyrophosphatase